MEKNMTVTVKTRRGSLVTVRGDNPEEFRKHAEEVINGSIEFTINLLEDAILAIDNSNDPVQIVQQSLGGEVINSAPSFAPVPPPSSSGGGTVDTIEDRWGNKWTYGRADAPVCANGPMVLKQGTNQSGKAYVGWFDPAGGPRWQGAKVPSDQQTAPKFGVKV